MSISDTTAAGKVCKICEKTAHQYCAACKTAYYCSREHQKADWPAHKARCLVDTYKKAAEYQLEMPFYVLGTATDPSMARFGVLTMRGRESHEALVKMPVGQGCLDAGDLVVPSPTGYIEDVMVYDRHTMKFLFMSRIHRQAISHLCGEEGVLLLESRRAIEGSAWLITGGDAKKASRGLFSLLHEGGRAVTEDDVSTLCARIDAENATS